MTRSYLSVSQAAQLLGVTRSTLSKYELPPPDVTIGEGRSTIRGWRQSTILAWNAARPGRGTRTDLHPPRRRTR